MSDCVDGNISGFVVTSIEKKHDGDTAEKLQLQIFKFHITMDSLILLLN